MALRKPKTKIKPPRKHGTDQSMQDTWAALARAIQEIHNHNTSKLSFEENFRYAYNLVLHKHGEMLYKGVRDLIAKNLDRLAKEQIIPAFPSGAEGDPTLRSQQGERLLKSFRRVWDDHIDSMSKLRDLLKYMDRSYTPHAQVPQIWDAGLDLFIQHILGPTIAEPLIATILAQIRIERDGYTINRSAVKSCVEVLLLLDHPSIYKKKLEPAVLQESTSFYREEGQKLLETCDAPEFLRRVSSRLESEESRCAHYLTPMTHPQLRAILEDNLITPNLGTVLDMPNSGLEAMIDGEKYDQIATLYKLYSMVPLGLPIIRKGLKTSVERRGKEVNEVNQDEDADEGEEGPAKPKGKEKALAQANAALKWVQDVLNLKDKFDRVQKQSFKDEISVQTALNEAFESFINRNPKAPEFISLFVDEHLKKGLKGKTEDEVDVVLDKTITVFRFITEKDVFERYYKTHLAKRLLNGRSVSDDAERGMLAKLKLECGYQFTQKLEGMFNDMRVSADITASYRKHIDDLVDVDRPIELSVTVMTSTFWPMTHSGSSCIMPIRMTQACQVFERYYLSKHSGRRLTWQPALGNADVKVAFKARTHELNVSTFALVILLLFEDVEDGERLSYNEIKDAVQIPDPELQRNLQSLACAKFKILKKHPPSRDVSTTDAFTFNNDFTANLQRIKIGLVASKTETTEERQDTRNKIDEERRHQTEACIVRIMKDRKTMAHNELINEVTRQLATRFQPNPIDIKKRIESLIEREYLERREDRKSYNYLA
ncbi:Cullin-domain-containing protein [Sistotremastrum niveocremeum HHB9708]|uniref:Cullin-domain-containing protein n=1 Tax=Sistotremastrum niveocremeum HHB9708 TaxID=1314777 RepID=A0A164NWU6_9AGAM|nr:Cullin-domain-containing protein [Sistotremastrum niveocremeum HHB9708]